MNSGGRKTNKPISRRTIAQLMALAPMSLIITRGYAQSYNSAVGAHAPRKFESTGRTVINNKPIPYRVVAGDTDLFDVRGRLVGSVFSFSYFREKVSSKDERPVAFVFNGGPGSSSVWLHLGAIGPRRVKLDRDVNPSVVPPYVLEDNPSGILDIADIVFVDPVGTGYSRLRGTGEAKDFYGIDEDASSMAQFINNWLTANDRWQSPKFIIGESYGAVRAAVMQRMLMGGPVYGGVMHAISINGIALVGPVLGKMGPGEPKRTSVVLLPAFAATAWYHNKIDRGGRTFGEFVSEVTEFARGDYRNALLLGSALTREEGNTIANRLSEYTGLATEIFDLSNLYGVSNVEFAASLLAEEGLDVGLYDSRYTLAHRQAVGDIVGDDPGMGQYTPIFAGAWHNYLHDDLGVTIAEPYATIMWKDLSLVWRRERNNVPPHQTYADDLALAMRRNPALKLLVATGHYDLVTPVLAARLDLEEANAPLDRIRFVEYESGHMPYLGHTADDFSNDIRRLIVESI